jgi:hypothetical protein
MLKDSLGGRAKTLLIATIAPGNNNYQESKKTLDYANQAKSIPVHANSSLKQLAKQLQEEVGPDGRQ